MALRLRMNPASWYDLTLSKENTEQFGYLQGIIIDLTIESICCLVKSHVYNRHYSATHSCDKQANAITFVSRPKPRNNTP